MIWIIATLCLLNLGLGVIAVAGLCTLDELARRQQDAVNRGNLMHGYIHNEITGGISKKLDRLISLIKGSQQVEEMKMAKVLDALAAESAKIQQLTNVVDSVEALIGTFKSQMQAMRDELAALGAGADIIAKVNENIEAIDTVAKRLAADVVANTDAGGGTGGGGAAGSDSTSG